VIQTLQAVEFPQHGRYLCGWLQTLRNVRFGCGPYLVLAALQPPYFRL
jgi:hypothetical protein